MKTINERIIDTLNEVSLNRISSEHAAVIILEEILPLITYIKETTEITPDRWTLKGISTHIELLNDHILKGNELWNQHMFPKGGSHGNAPASNNP